jgi:hypothetical protein
MVRVQFQSLRQVMATSKALRFLKYVLVYAGIIVVTLLVIDGICIASGLFPPGMNYGDADLGWRSGEPTGRMAIGKCTEFSTGETKIFQRNEDGVRTGLSRATVLADTHRLRIGVSGDSQTDLCAPNDQISGGVLEAELNAHGHPSAVLTYGAGRYSPLQAYLAFRKMLVPYRPNVFILQVYTGNDLYDILRADDRPHFEATQTGYRIAEPIWYSFDDPGIRRRSRVLYMFRTLGDRTGIRQILLREAELRRLGRQHGAGLFAVISYMRDLWKAREPSLGYPDALSAQVLNQQLFFQHFPSAKEESIRRMRELMTMIRRENPGLMLVMSPIPSYELVGAQPIDAALQRTLTRLPITFEEGQRQEDGFYERLRQLASEQQWTFVDNLAALRNYKGSGRLYNDFDYHLLPPASALVGQAQAEVLLRVLPRSSR